MRVTWEHDDAQRYVAEAVERGVATVIAGGGDGTINEVAGALTLLPAAQRPCLGILPLGTANDFATACTIPLELDKALRLAIAGKPVPIDIAQVNNDRFFYQHGHRRLWHPHHHRNPGKTEVGVGRRLLFHPWPAAHGYP